MPIGDAPTVTVRCGARQDFSITSWNTYDSAGRLLRAIAREGNSTDYTYDVRHNVLTETRKPKSGTNTLVTTNTYFTGSTVAACPANETKRCNQVASVNGPRTDVTDVTSYTYNQTTGQVATVTGPAVQINATGTAVSPLTSYTYTLYSTNAGFAQVSLLTRTTEKIDATNNVLTDYTYFPLAGGRLAPQSMIVDVGGLALTTGVTYDSVGNARSVTDPRGSQSWFCFDNARRLTRIAKLVGAADDATIADCGATPSVVTGDDLVTRYEYSVDNDLLKTRQRDTDGDVWRDTVYTYTPTKSLATVTDPQGNVTTNAYDALDRLAMVTDAAGRKTRTFYFPDSKVRKVLRAYQFTAADPNEACSLPGTDQQCYAQYLYAPSGQPAANYNGQAYSVTDANGNVTAYTYDVHDRQQRTTFPGGLYEELLYTTSGVLNTKRNRAGDLITHGFDALNRLAAKSHTSFPAVTYGYDLLSRQTVVNQASGQALSFVFDKAGRLGSTTAGSRTVSYLYDAAGNRTRVTWPDAFYVQYSYDTANRMDQVQENGNPAQTLADYNYDTLSRRKELIRANGDTTSYAYEADNDLSSIVHAGLPSTPTFTFTRNPVHQLLTSTVSDNSLSWAPTINSNVGYVANALNQYSSVGGTAYTYDAKGNLANDGTSAYTYDAENRLKQATKSGTTTTYSYDGLGRRIAKSVGGTVTNYLLDGDEEIAEYDGAGTLLRRYVYGPSIDDRIVMYADATITSERYYYVNHQGSTVRVADAAGTVTDSFTYSPYGESSTVTGNPFRYTGRRYDAETELYYYRARYYSPKLGRFLQTDPIGYKDDVNLYAYARNDPGSLVDPRGDTPILAGAIVGGAILGVLVQAGSDLYKGNDFKVGNYLAAAAGGAAAGALASVGQFAAAGALGSAIASAGSQLTEHGDISVGETATAAAAALGPAAKVVPKVPVPGVTTGRNSYGAVARGVSTRMQNGSATRASASTYSKAIAANVAGGVAEAAAEAAASEAANETIDTTVDAIQDGIQSIGTLHIRPPSLHPCLTGKPCAN